MTPRAGPRVHFNRLVVRPIQSFLRVETAGGMVLLAATIFAIVAANSPWDGDYARFWAYHVGLDRGAVSLDKSLAHWVNDGLMTVFFFVVGLEIKRELATGELSDRRAATLPAAAAIGGMILPAAIFAGLNLGTAGGDGWAIPMATDIAFSVGVLALLGSRAPAGLKAFLLALAIVDDIGAILVIALFYTGAVSFAALGAALLLVAVVIALNRLGVRAIWPYAVAGIACWFALLQSGVHATIAGVVLGLLTPERPRDDEPEGGSPLDRLEHALHPWSSFVVIPVFALANAGLAISGDRIADAAQSRVSLGIAFGLVAGKPLGIIAFAWLAVRLRLAILPAGTTWRGIVGVGLVAGIGFTVSLFITELAYSNATLVQDAKIAIFGASLVAGAAGYLYLRLLQSPRTSGDPR